MAYVLDTNVLSALRVRGRHPVVEQWASSVTFTKLFVSAMTIADVERGVIAKEEVDPSQGTVLRRWLDEQVLPAFEGRVLAFDHRAARILAKYPVPQHAPLDDAITAAIAKASGMTVVTRNTKHFDPLGVACLNPWDQD